MEFEREFVNNSKSENEKGLKNVSFYDFAPSIMHFLDKKRQPKNESWSMWDPAEEILLSSE